MAAEKLDRIEELNIEDIMGERFGRYSKYIIQERALPDIRDGLKPVQRRILFAMDREGNTYDHQYRKSAKSVGTVMGNYHPHGDSSIYEAMVRMSQDWKLREPLIDMSGNNGSIDNDPAAAMRYTEARLSKTADLMLDDLDKETVNMVLNFDDTLYEATVLPSKLPNLLLNGSTGISAGYATDIPPHNLVELIDATILLLNKPESTLSNLMKYVKGPDFPTGGIIQGLDGIKEAYKTGKGKIVVRAKTEIVDLAGGKKQINITEIPYETNKANIVKKIDEIRIDKEIPGIAAVRDSSDRNGLLIEIELVKDVNIEGILAYLFKKSDLQVNYNFNMVTIHKQRPERVGLKTALQAFIDFRQEIITKRTQFELNKAQGRQHIVEGLIKMVSILDEVVDTIRHSENRKDAKQNIMDKFGFTDPQAEAIITLQLYRLTNTDIVALQNEHDELNKSIEAFNKILNDKSELNSVIESELTTIKKEYGNPRRSVIESEVEELEFDDTITVSNEDVVVQVTRLGYAKRASVRSFNSSNNENGLVEGDYPIIEETLNTLEHLFIFTTSGSIIYRQVHELAELRFKENGAHLSQEVSGLTGDDQIVKVIKFESLENKGSFVLASDDGLVKRVDFSEVVPPKTYKKKAYLAMKVKKDSKLVSVDFVKSSKKDQTVISVTKSGTVARFNLDNLEPLNSRATGVLGVDLADKKDSLVNTGVVSNSDYLAVVDDKGQLTYKKIEEFKDDKLLAKGQLIGDQPIAAAVTFSNLKTKLKIVTDKNQIVDVKISDYSQDKAETVVDKKQGNPIQIFEV